MNLLLQDVLFLLPLFTLYFTFNFPFYLSTLPVFKVLLAGNSVRLSSTELCVAMKKLVSFFF